LAFLGNENSAQPAPFDFFWGPVVHTNEPVLLCVADQSAYPVITLRDAADPSRKTLLKDDLTAIVIDDLIPVVRVAALLEPGGTALAELSGTAGLWRGGARLESADSISPWFRWAQLDLTALFEVAPTAGFTIRSVRHGPRVFAELEHVNSTCR